MLTRPARVSIFVAQLAVIGACGSDSGDDGSGAGGSAPGGDAGSFGAAGVGGNAGSDGAGGAGGDGAGGDGSGGTAAAGDGGAGGSGTGSGPVDASQASIASFLAGRPYQAAPWVSETPAPRDGTEGTGTPHGRVRVYFNDTLVSSIAAGNGAFGSNLPHTTGSMAVKELYDETDTRVGVAAALKTEGNFQRWVYYCFGPGERCAWGRGPFTEAEPLYGVGGQVDCGICHGGLVFTAPPN